MRARETAGVALLAGLALVLPLQGGDLGPGVVVAVVLAVALGTEVARRRPADGGPAERLLRRGAVAALVAFVALVVLVAATGQAGALR